MPDLSFAQKINATIGKTNMMKDVGNHKISNIAPANAYLYTFSKRPVIHIPGTINEIIKISLLFFEMIKDEK
jgi:hypothetical protein